MRSYVSGFESNQFKNAGFLCVHSSVVFLNTEMEDWLDSDEQKYPSVFCVDSFRRFLNVFSGVWAIA